MSNSILFVLVLALGALACRADAGSPEEASESPGLLRIGDVLWYVDYEAAVAAAKRQDKPLWVHFGEDPG